MTPTSNAAPNPDESPFDEPRYENVEQGIGFVDRWHERREPRAAAWRRFVGLLRRDRTIYGCGNCRETFKTEAEMHAHQPCPLVVLEREVAERTAAARQRIAYTEAEFDVE